MRKGRPMPELVLTDEERLILERRARSRTLPQQVVQRAQIVLCCAEGRTNQAVAKEVGVTPQTVGKWRGRFVDERLAGLFDAPRSGAPRTVEDEQVMEVVNRTLAGPPKGATHWSTRGMAQATGISQSSVVRIWHAFALQPHRTESFKLSTDPFFVEKVRDIVGLYLHPPDKALVLCVDEKSQVQALDRTQLLLPLRPGIPARQTHDYIRHGTTSLFAALDAATGKVIGRCHRRHRHQEFLKFLRAVDASISTDEHGSIHLVLDNAGTHKTPAVRRWFVRHPQYHLHFTPTGSSWVNLVERFFAEITNKRIRRGTFSSVPDLERAIRGYLDCHNEKPKPFIWTATADAIFAKIKRFCERTSDSGH